ncbi:MAG: tail fiber domain-containing protein, partial [Planctomycetota bacterium]
IGVIAQDVEKVFPELVSEPTSNYKSVDYTKLTAVLIEAVKELKTENEILRERVDALEGMQR